MLALSISRYLKSTTNAYSAETKGTDFKEKNFSPYNALYW